MYSIPLPGKRKELALKCGEHCRCPNILLGLDSRTLGTLPLDEHPTRDVGEDASTDVVPAEFLQAQYHAGRVRKVRVAHLIETLQAKTYRAPRTQRIGAARRLRDEQSEGIAFAPRKLKQSLL